VFNFEEKLLNSIVDEGQIQQVFSNLTINAKQASPDGGHLYFSVNNCFVNDNEILELNSGQYLKIIVRDEGEGIPEEDLDKVFDPYFTTKQKGNGLGLATAYSIVKSHNGYLDIDSDLGNGTTFTIYLPASKKEEILEEKNSEIIIEKEFHTAKILIMDDDVTICKLLSLMAKKLGYEYDTAIDGEQAISKYVTAKENRVPFDIIIMDLTIPGGMGGKEAVKEILDINKNAKVIVSSGYTSGSVLAEYKSFGFVDMIDKPYTMTKLKVVLDRVLNEV